MEDRHDNHEWVQEFPGGVTVCDEHGVIIAMNQTAAGVFAKDGGRELIGRNVLDCHPEPARTRLETMLRERTCNAYTIEKRGVRKLIYQAPWTRSGKFAGIIELSLELPDQLPHFVRG